MTATPSLSRDMRIKQNRKLDQFLFEFKFEHFNIILLSSSSEKISRFSSSG